MDKIYKINRIFKDIVYMFFTFNMHRSENEGHKLVPIGQKDNYPSALAVSILLILLILSNINYNWPVSLLKNGNSYTIKLGL